MDSHELRFAPDWVVAPAATLYEFLEDNGISINVLAVAAAGQKEKIGNAKLLRGVLDRKPITESVAWLLERGTGIPARLWLALEHNYRVGLAAGKSDFDA